MTNQQNAQVANLQAEIAIQKAEKAANQAKQSAEDLERLQQSLTSPEMKEANKIAAEAASKATMEAILKNKKTDTEVKTRVANQLIEQANSAKIRADKERTFSTQPPKQKQKQKQNVKKSNIKRKLIFVFIAFALLISIAYFNGPKNTVKPRTIIP
jgi:hypothetical protein